MGGIYKADFMVDNGKDFDKYNLSTSADQVSYEKDGKTTDVQSGLDALSTDLANLSVDAEVKAITAKTNSCADITADQSVAVVRNGVCYCRILANIKKAANVYTTIGYIDGVWFPWLDSGPVILVNNGDAYDSNNHRASTSHFRFKPDIANKRTLIDCMPLERQTDVNGNSPVSCWIAFPCQQQ